MSATSAGDGKPRLVIKRLELENFKSYAGVQHIGPFHKNLSAIMGPNGSGKSNVIDAMLFVFGRRAKQLRLNKVSELIHNSTHHRNVQQARVSVFFEDILETAQDTFETVPNSDLEVSRTASKDNLSHYYVNGKKSSAKEVTELLKSKGVDLDNSRLLNLQGEVEQISLMKPKAEDEHDSGLLEYLEDIVGTKHYVENITRAAGQLEEMSEERRKHLQLVKVAQGKVDDLEDDKIAAEAYRQKEAQFYCVKINVLKCNKNACEKNVEKLQELLTGLEEKKDYETGKLAKKRDELKELEEGEKAAENKVKKLQRSKDEAEAAITKLAQSRATDAKKQEHAQKKKEAADALYKTKTNKLAESEKQLATCEEEVPDAEADVLQKQNDLDEAQAKLDEMLKGVQDETAEVQQRLTQARTAAAPWRTKLQAIREEHDLAATQADLLRKSMAGSGTRREEASAELQSTDQDLVAHQSRLATVKKSCAEHKVEIQEKGAAAERARKAVATTEAAASEARIVLQGLSNAISSAKTQGQVAKVLADAQKRGHIRGLHGRLGDLGSIDAQYDAAASNASGALDNFVVDTTEDAQAAVRYLRENGLGLATFIILDKQRDHERQANEQVTTPEGAPRLVDLVKCSDEMRVAFFFAFRNTIVAKDIDQASRLGLRGNDRRFARVVTLQGELVAENGTMSGGGNRVMRGKMRLGSKVPMASQQSQQDVTQAEARLQELEQTLQEQQRDLAENEAAAKAAQEALCALSTDQQKEELAVQSLLRKVQNLKNQLQKIEADIAQAAKGQGELESYEAAIAKHKADMERVTADAADAEAAVAEVEKELSEVGGQPMREQREQVEVLKKDVEDARSTVKKQKANIDVVKKSIKTIAADIKKKAKEIESLDRELSEYQENTETGETRQATLQAEVAELDGQLSVARERLEEVATQAKSQRAENATIETVVETVVAAYEEKQGIFMNESEKVGEVDGHIAAFMKDLEETLSGADADIMTTDDAIKSDEEIAAMTEEDSEKLVKRATFLDAQLTEERKTVDLKVIEKYREKKSDLDKKQAELAEVTERRNAARGEHDELRKKRLEEFMHGFGIISTKLQEIYQMITIGGDAELSVVDSLDPFSEGIVFEVRPPKKSWKNIRNLSGGEKTLSSLALVFALHHYKPTPLYFMDEIDAALDFKNVSIVANYIKAQTRNAQFVVISLRNHMFELADRLMGIYKVQNCTSSLTIEPHQLCYGSGNENVKQVRPVLQQQRA